jgi:hypothetical protein
MPDHSRLPSLRTTQLLVALSCYIQIISVYDSIFTAMIEYLASGGPPTPVTSVSSSHHQTSTHTLYLGGLPVPTDWKLCRTLLAHQIEYQLERIEILIGLPEQYRVSSKPGDDGKAKPVSSQCCVPAGGPPPWRTSHARRLFVKIEDATDERLIGGFLFANYEKHGI